MIELVGVNKTFTTKDLNVEACKDVNLKIEDGDIFGIIGFSGAGKSTLVRCINLLERPTSGKVLIDGVDITQLKEAELRKIRKKIGMIFQHFNLMRSRTVYQNIAYQRAGSADDLQHSQAAEGSQSKAGHHDRPDHARNGGHQGNL